MNHKVKVNASEIMKGVTVKVELSGLRWFMFKARIGFALIRLGTWISGANWINK